MRPAESWADNQVQTYTTQFPRTKRISLILHRHLLHSRHRILQLSYPLSYPCFYLGGYLRRGAVYRVLERGFQLLQFFLGGSAIIGCVDGLFLCFFGGNLEFISCCGITEAC